MPLIVKELIVKARVQDSEREQKTSNSSMKKKVGEERESIIQDTVEQVLEILERQKER